MFTNTKKLSVKPSVDELQFLLECGYLERDMGRYQEAIDIFLGASALLPENSLPGLAVGNVLLASGRAADAQAQIEKVLQRFPEDAFAMAHLGEVLFHRKEIVRAKEYLEKALAKDPKGPGGQMARSYLQLVREVEKGR